MIQYRVNFSQGGTLLLSKEQYEVFEKQLNLVNFQSTLVFIGIDKSVVFVNLSKIECVIREEVEEPRETVIKPPTPSEVREEKQREEGNQDITLDAQLAQAGEVPQE